MCQWLVQLSENPEYTSHSRWYSYPGTISERFHDIWLVPGSTWSGSSVHWPSCNAQCPEMLPPSAQGVWGWWYSWSKWFQPVMSLMATRPTCRFGSHTKSSTVRFQ